MKVDNDLVYNRLLSSNYININPIEGLNLRSTFSIDYAQKQQNKYTPNDIIKHLEKLVNTVEVVDFRNTDNVYRETVLTRIGVDSATRHEVIEFCQILGAHIVDVTRDALTIEVTGGEYKIDRFLSLIEDYDVQMLTRSGRIALPKPCQ